MDLLLFILGLGLLIFLHELGHYLACRIFNIPVEEFGFGLPPRILKLFTLGGTDFTINAIPFGAFVRPKGEDNADAPGGLSAASPWVRLAVLLAGPIMNLVTGILLFAIIFMRDGLPVVKIVEVVNESPASQSGLMVGDQIVQINGKNVIDSTMLINNVRRLAGQEITLQVVRDGQSYVYQAVPRINPPAGQGSLGIVMEESARPVQAWYEPVTIGIQYAYEQIVSVLSIPGQLARGTVSAEEARVVGPKGMYDIFSATAQRLKFLAVISIALGFTNLLPIPAMDGGRILFLLPELILRKRIPARFENVINQISLVLLIILMFYITIQDFIKPVLGQ